MLLVLAFRELYTTSLECRVEINYVKVVSLNLLITLCIDNNSLHGFTPALIVLQYEND